MTDADASGRRPPYGAATVTGAVVFGLYLLTLAPTTAFWDASEYIATAHILGIPHPPGNPLFVALGKVWLTLLAPLGLSVAVRVNMLAALTSAVASGFLFLVAHWVLTRIVEHRWMAVAGAAASALIGATAFTVWNQSTVNEKVYTVSVMVIAAVSWLALRWMDRREERGSERYLLVAGYLMVLGSTNHLMSLLPLPALGLLVVVTGAGVLAKRSFWVRAVPLVLLGLSFNFFLPVRSAQDPVINEGEPTCATVPGAAVSVFTAGWAGCPALSASLQREQYRKPPVTERMAPLPAQLLNWFQYFDWQWARGADPSEVPGNARMPFTLLFLALGLVGLWAVVRADLRAGVYLGVLTTVLTVGLVYYLNFRYGYSLYPEIADRSAHEVRERDYFFIAGFIVWGMLAGVGLTWAWNVVQRQLRHAGAAVVTAPVLAVALIPLALNWGWASRSGEHAARDWAWDLLMSVEPYAVLFTNGDNDTFPLWYLQEVEGVRRDVTVIVGQYLGTAWYPDQLRRLTSPGRQRPFEGDAATALYGDGHPAPERAVTRLSPDSMAQIRGGVLGEDLTVTFPELAVTFPEGMRLDRTQALALAIIRDSIDERPVYFSSSSGLMNGLGLARWGVRHGLVTRLVLQPSDRPRPDGWVRGSPNMGGEWFDYDRTLTLYEDVYRHEGFKEVDVWADRATLNIPWHYYALALQLADVGGKSGMPGRRIAELHEDAAAFLVTARGGVRGTPGRVGGQ